MLADQGLAQPLPKQTAIRQAGQRVIEGQIANLLLVGLGLRDVANEGDNAGDSPSISAIASGKLRPEDLSTLPPQPNLQIAAAPSFM